MISGDDVMKEDGTAKQAVDIAKQQVTNQADTYHGTGKKPGDYEKVCLKCVRNIYSEANIPFPATNSVVTFMDAMDGIAVDLFNNPKDSNGRRMRVPYAGRKDWSEITMASGLVPGDIMVVMNADGGLHATMVTNVQGGPNSQGLFQGYYTGVDVIHDRGPSSPVQSSHYEWHELVEGQGGDAGDNRKFVNAYRYSPKEVETMSPSERAMRSAGEDVVNQVLTGRVGPRE